MKSGLTCVALVVTMTASAQARAQQREVRFEQTFKELGARGTTLLLDRAQGSSSWDVRLVNAKTSQALSEASFPEWAGAPYYTYQASTIAIGASFVVLLEATPKPNAPNIAASFQVAFARTAKSAAWKQVATTRHSDFDGGERLMVRVRNNRAELVRVGSRESALCGQNAATAVYDPDVLGFRTEVDLETMLATAGKARTTTLADQFADDGLPGYYLWFLATSDRRNPDDSRTVIRPIELGDGRLGSAWSEGRPDLGHGQFVTARINPSLKLRGFRLFPGHGANAAEFKAFAYPTQLLVTTEAGAWTVDVPARDFENLSRAGGVLVQLPESVRTRCLSVAILDSLPGDATGENAWKASATAVSEITPISEIHGLPPDFAAVVVVEKLLKETEGRNTRRLATLTAPLGPQLAVLLERVATEGSEEDRQRVAPLLRNIPSEQAVPILMDLFDAAHPDAPYYDTVRRGLEMHRDVAGPRLAQVLRERPPVDERKHLDLMRLVGRLSDPDDLRFLSSQLGEGSAKLRKERVRAIVRAAETVLPELFALMRSKPDTDAAQDALRAISVIGRKLHERGSVAFEGASAITELAREAKDPRTRILAVRTTGYFVIEDGQTTLTRLVTSDRNPLVRRAAVQAIARDTARDARLVTEAALFDESPDVRIAAAEAILNRDDRLQSVPALREYLESETWPAGMRAGFAVLAEMEDDSVQTYLEREILKAPYTARAELIADALKRGQKAIRVGVARQIFSDPKTSFALKRHCIDALGKSNESDAEAMLREIAEADEPFSEFDEDRNRNLQVRSLLALGRMRTPVARDYLLKRLRAASDLNWQLAVLRALSFSADPTVADALEAFLETAPESLHEDVRETIATVRRRQAFDEVVETIED